MATERNVVDFKIHNLTEEQFQELKAQGKIDPNAVYCTPDESLKTDQITNCITEIPQDIKYTLVDGTLKVLAGSTFYYPNGQGVFNKKTLTSDLPITGAVINASGSMMIFISESGTGLQARLENKCSSGTAKPGVTYSAWWDTTNNVINNYASDASTPAAKLSLPILTLNVKNENSVYTITEVTQVFNGFGYMGSTVFVLPEVKGLIPNDRNEDGTLKNISCTVPAVKVQTMPTYMVGRGNCPVFLSTSYGHLYITSINNNAYFEVDKFSDIDTSVPYSTWFVREENQWYVKGESASPHVKKELCLAGSFGVDSDNKIARLDIKLPFRAVDYNDFEELDNSAVHKTGNETIDGTKTFKQKISIHDTGKDASTTPTTNRYWGGVEFRDKNAVLTGYVRSNHLTNGNIRSDMQVVRTVDGKAKYAELGVELSPTGVATAYAPTPAASSNGTNIATTEWVNNAAVHKTGDETIGGIKTFQAAPVSGNDGYITKTTYAKGSTLSNVQYFWVNTVYDKGDETQSNKLSQIYTQVDKSGASRLVMASFKNVAGDTTSTSLSVGYDANGNVTTYAPTPSTSSNTTNIATTEFVKSVLSGNGVGLATFSKGNSGYYKFSNGLIIQWGTVTGTTVTYPTAFSSATSYAITVTMVRSSSTSDGHNYLYNHTSTGCNVEAASSDVSRWIAIGY